MTIIELSGGLGNQMFQYALGMAISESTGQVVKFNPRYSQGDTQRHYELGCFGVEIYKSTKLEIYLATLQERHPFAYLPKILKEPILKLNGWKVVKDSSLHFNPKIFENQTHQYLIGTWASYKYFESVENIIRKAFEFPRPKTAVVKEYLQQIKLKESVSIHIRRGDYASNPKTRKFHGLLPLTYYHQAIDLIKTKVKDPTFFVFSDDLEWCKANLKLGEKAVFVEHADRDFQDMHLMSQCHHQIIANSTFSWWGAWLNPNQIKLVVAPKKWFNQQVATNNLLPQSWIRL